MTSQQPEFQHFFRNINEMFQADGIYLSDYLKFIMCDYVFRVDAVSISKVTAAQSLDIDLT